MKSPLVFCAVMLAALPALPALAAPQDVAAALMDKAAKANLILVGEMHGTHEVPALVGQLATRWSAAGAAQPIVIALEYPQGEAAELQAFAASDGGAPARARLLATPFWSRAFQDGRSSGAMLALIDALRMQARQGHKITLAAFDWDAVQQQAQVHRDRAMADNLRAIVQANPGARVIALTGNYHARQSDGAPWDAQYRFMGSYLKDLAPYSVYLEALRGSYWGCSAPSVAACKTVEFDKDAPAGLAPGLYADPALAANGYTQGVRLAAFSASLPASIK